jgi:hypothetical protein
MLGWRGATALRAQGTGIISTVAGDGTPGFFRDSGPATKAELNEGPFVMAPDNHGNVYILDEQNNRVRKVNTAGIMGAPAYLYYISPTQINLMFLPT